MLKSRDPGLYCNNFLEMQGMLGLGQEWLNGIIFERNIKTIQRTIDGEYENQK